MGQESGVLILEEGKKTELLLLNKKRDSAKAHVEGSYR